MTIFNKAREFAIERHWEQLYDGGSYVVNHLDQTVLVLVRFGDTRPDLLAATVLHDILEDTDTTQHELDVLFGPNVGSLVWYVTDEQGKNRRERKMATYKKIRGSSDAVKIKLADRIANVEASLRSTEKSLFGMYRKEYDVFRAHLYREGEHEEMWEHLDTLLKQEWVVG